MIYICPENGKPTRCLVCFRVHRHRREQLVGPFERIPECETHRVALVPAR